MLTLRQLLSNAIREYGEVPVAGIESLFTLLDILAREMYGVSEFAITDYNRCGLKKFLHGKCGRLHMTDNWNAAAPARAEECLLLFGNEHPDGVGMEPESPSLFLSFRQILVRHEYGLDGAIVSMDY